MSIFSSSGCGEMGGAGTSVSVRVRERVCVCERERVCACEWTSYEGPTAAERACRWDQRGSQRASARRPAVSRGLGLERVGFSRAPPRRDRAYGRRRAARRARQSSARTPPAGRPATAAGSSRYIYTGIKRVTSAGGSSMASKSRVRSPLVPVVGVKHHWHTVDLRHRTHVVGTGDGAGDGGLEVLVVEALACKELRAAA